MSGNERNPANDHTWYVLRDEMTDAPLGYIDEHGNTKDTTPDTEERVRTAFQRDLLVQDGEMVDELGMCFDGVCAVRPADPEHDALVLRNLGALSGLRPEPAGDDENPES